MNVDDIMAELSSDNDEDKDEDDEDEELDVEDDKKSSESSDKEEEEKEVEAKAQSQKSEVEAAPNLLLKDQEGSQSSRGFEIMSKSERESDESKKAGKLEVVKNDSIEDKEATIETPGQELGVEDVNLKEPIAQDEQVKASGNQEEDIANEDDQK